MAKIDSALLASLEHQDFDYSVVQSYLVQILDGQDIEVYVDQLGRVEKLDYEQGWQFIEQWALEHNFSFSRRASRKAKIESLLDNIGNRQKLKNEAASSLGAMLRQARETPPASVQNVMSDSLKKALAIQREQITRLNSNLFDPLYHAYYSSPLLAHIQNDDLRRRAALTLAGNPSLAANFTSSGSSYGKIHTAKLINDTHHLLRQTIPELEPFYQEMRSDEFEDAAVITFGKAQEVLKQKYAPPAGVISQTGIDLAKLNADLETFRRLAAGATSITSVEDILHKLPDTYLAGNRAEREKLIRDIKKIVIAASSGPHLSGDALLDQLVKDQKLTATARVNLNFLAPELEILEVAARTELIGASVTDRKKNRELWTQGLAENLGINASIFWVKEKDLNSAADHFLKDYNLPIPSGKSGIDLLSDKLFALKTAFDLEMGKEHPDLGRSAELNQLIDRTSQFRDYMGQRHGVVAIQDFLAKFNYNYRVIKEPVDKANHRLWSMIEKVDDVINFPARSVATFWENLQDGKFVIGKFSREVPTVISFVTKNCTKVRIPLLNLPGFVVGQYVALQKSAAIKTATWAYGLAGKGTFPHLFNFIGDYAHNFSQFGSWRETNFYMLRKAGANFLNWGAQKLWKKSWTEAVTIGKKALFQFGNKVSGGLLAKAAAYLTSIGLSAEGIGLITGAIMIAWDLLKLVGGFFKKIFTDEKFRNKILNLVPIGIGMFFTGIAASLAGIPVALAFGFSSLLAGLGIALGGIAALFTQAILWAGALIVGIYLIFQVITITTKLDPGLGIFTAIVCDEDGKAEANPVVSCATCLVDYLTQCYQNPVTGSKLSARGVGCLIAQKVAPDVAAAIEASAVKYDYLQCVGFARAAAVCAGGDLPGQAVASDYIRMSTPGYKFVAGANNCSEGDFGIIDGLVGHIFVVGPKNGATITAIDANFICKGCVSSSNPIPTGRVAGCLKKN